jgi:D-aminopeptidase
VKWPPVSCMKCRSWKGAAVRRGREQVLEAVTRKRVVKTLSAEKGLACAVVTCNMWKSEILLQLFVVTTCT